MGRLVIVRSDQVIGRLKIPLALLYSGERPREVSSAGWVRWAFRTCSVPHFFDHLGEVGNHVGSNLLVCHGCLQGRSTPMEKRTLWDQGARGARRQPSPSNPDERTQEHLPRSLRLRAATRTAANTRCRCTRNERRERREERTQEPWPP